MATILLSAAGAALGSGFGGTVLGLSGAVIGRAVGATLGRAIDQRILGGGSETVESGRVDQFRLTGASDGAAVREVWGRARVGGQVIWSTKFLETSTSTGGGKGAPQPKTTEFTYTVSLAIALCRGTALRVGRVWADGMEIAPDSLDLRFYSGSEDQLPDPKIEAVEGAGLAPSYRGIAYVVIENLDLSRFGNRVPQFSFEVVRQAQGEAAAPILDIADSVHAVALIPGTGEYALATTPVHFTQGPGVSQSINVNSASGKTDFATSLQMMREELPFAGSVSLVVSWFGSDLRCAECTIQPKVEQVTLDGEGMPWTVSGVGRSAAQVVPQSGGRVVYGGTPTDQSVIEAIQAIRAGGQEVMFYPFILMDQLAGNGLPDPWSDASDQPALPWRGRITLTKAPGRQGSPDRSAAAAAEAEVATFLGTAMPADFTVAGGSVVYSGPVEWRYRRMVLHYAHLCALAGGVDAFCIGSELRSLTQIREAGDAFPMVAALRQLAAEVRAILGAGTKISYAADWSEYFGYQTGDNVYFHLDPLWADANIDFVGIDNYMPVSDWRDNDDQADAAWGAICNVEYLKANIAGGEGFEWYYDGPEGEAAQLRKPITDGAYDEPWVFRYKDIRNWWGMNHHERLDGVRAAQPTVWVPGSKPIRFTEYGCAAIDKATNQPNLFLDPKSSESALPRASNGRRDDFIQMQYLRAMHEFWSDPANNPVATAYSGKMLDLAHSHVWAWDARPFPEFPGNIDLWGDGDNYTHGHWLNGRSSAVPLAGVVAELCEQSGVTGADVSSAYGVVRGYAIDQTGTARSALQPLCAAFGLDTLERDGQLLFRLREGKACGVIDPDRLAMSAQIDGALEATRSAAAETSGRVRISYFEAENDFDARTAEAVFPDDSSPVVSTNDLPLLLTGSEARGTAERWLSEARVGRDSVRFALPKSGLIYGAGDTVQVNGLSYRIDRMEQTELLMVDTVRVEPSIYQPGEEITEQPVRSGFAAPLPVFPLFLDLPLLTGDEVPQAPHIAVTASPWPGTVALWSAASDDGYSLNHLIESRAVIGVTQTPLFAAAAGGWDRGAPVRVVVSAGQLASVSQADVLAGLNVAAIGDGTPGNWEVFQFTTATMVAPGTYDLTLRLRGQAGTDAQMPAAWPAGSYFVLLGKAVQQIDLPSSARGILRFYRIGASSLGYDDANVVVAPLAFAGIGLRPYSVCALVASGAVGSGIGVSWIRRTRIDGDSWDSFEVPLGEDRELYLVRVYDGARLAREVQVTSPAWSYSAAMQDADALGASFDIAVAQISDRFGPGPFTRLTIS